MQRNREYDRFGPWIMEISEEDPPPPLFQPYLTKDETPLLSIKIPRKIDRHAAKPGMNLYDYMVTLYDGDLEILQRVGDGVTKHTFLYSDVLYIRFGEHLLKGDLLLGMPERVFDLPFNTVSVKVMEQLVEHLRSRYAVPEKWQIVGEELINNEDEFSFYFKRVLAGEKVNFPHNRLLAAQSESNVGSSEAQPLRKIVFGILSKSLLESIHFCDGRELKIINRGQDYRLKWQTVHGKDVCYLPVTNIRDFSWEDDEQNTAVLHLVLQTNAGNISYAFLRDNPTIENYSRALINMQTPTEILAI